MAKKRMTLEESKEITKKLLKNIDDQIENSLVDDRSYSSWLRQILHCPKYSINNATLLLMKYKDPIAKTRKQWESIGVHVTDDWKNYTYLLRPVLYDGFYKNRKWVPYSKASDEDKNKIKSGEYKRISGVNFSRYAVYDISQTDADEDTIVSQRLENSPKTYEMHQICEATNMSVGEFMDCVKDEVHILALENGLKDHLVRTYEAGTNYLCGERLGIDSNINSFYLQKDLNKMEMKEMKKITKMIVNDSQSIIDNLLESLGVN